MGKLGARVAGLRSDKPALEDTGRMAGSVVWTLNYLLLKK